MPTDEVRTEVPAESSLTTAAPPQLLPGPARFLGRQPIVTERSHLFGYELLFRASDSNAFSGDPEQATRDVVDQWLMLLPDAQNQLAFVNCTREALIDGTVELLSPQDVVLEILENINPDATLLASCAALRDKGYRFALDDFLPDSARSELYSLADFIKVDIRITDAPAWRAIRAIAAKTGARLIAEKVETEEERAMSLGLGCTLFQGYFFSRPVILESRTLPQNHLLYLRLLSALQEVPTDLRVIENLVSSEPSLCYRVLRLANSAIQGHSGVVTSVRGALLMVGEDAVRTMVAVALASLAGIRRPQALVSMALVRAQFCRQLAPVLGEQPQRTFLLGMFSLLDALLGVPMSRILENLPISPTMKAALLGEPGPLGSSLDLVRALEACDWQRCQSIRTSLGVSEQKVASLYLDSLQWAARMTGV